MLKKTRKRSRTAVIDCLIGGNFLSTRENLRDILYAIWPSPRPGFNCSTAHFTGMRRPGFTPKSVRTRLVIARDELTRAAALPLPNAITSTILSFPCFHELRQARKDCLRH